MAVVKSVKVGTRTVIHLLLPHLVRIHLLPLSKPRGIIELTAVQRLLDGAHDVGKRLAVRPAQLNRIIVILHHMGITVIRNTCTLLRAYHNADTIQLTTHVKVRHSSIVVSQTNGHYPPVLCLKRGILALAVVACCAKSIGNRTSEKFALIGKFFKIFY